MVTILDGEVQVTVGVERMMRDSDVCARNRARVQGWLIILPLVIGASPAQPSVRRLFDFARQARAATAGARSGQPGLSRRSQFDPSPHQIDFALSVLHPQPPSDRLHTTRPPCGCRPRPCAKRGGSCVRSLRFAELSNACDRY